MILRIIFVLIVGAGIYMWHKSAEKNIVYSAQDNEVQQRQGQPEVAQEQDAAQQEGEQSEAVTEEEFEMPIVQLPGSVRHSVPFVAQAPLAQWDDKRFQDACEEASILMAYQWVGGDQELNNEDATAALEEIFEAQKPLFGEETIDTSASDTALLMKEFFGHETRLVNDFKIEDMLQVLAQEQIIIIPTDGKKLKNPYFSGGGPDRHMLVITGFDQEKREFITNDPGTRRGKEFAYEFDLLYDAIRDYKTGIKEPIDGNKKAMIIVSKS